MSKKRDVMHRQYYGKFKEAKEDFDRICRKIQEAEKVYIQQARKTMKARRESVI